MSVHRVYLVRHAKAEPQGAGRDDERRLTRDGRTRFTALVGALADRLRVTRVVTSPLVRARQTAEILAAATGAAVEEEPRLASGCSGPRELLAMLRGAAPGTALVGHNPEIAEALAQVADLDLEVKPGAVAALDVDGDALALAWFEAPG
jgi:phosphohistidine phosphatase